MNKAPLSRTSTTAMPSRNRRSSTRRVRERSHGAGSHRLLRESRSRRRSRPGARQFLRRELTARSCGRWSSASYPSRSRLSGCIGRPARMRARLQRTGENMQKAVKSALGRDRYRTSRDGDRHVIWRSAEIVTIIVPYRDGGDRGHGDVPLCKLAGLARTLGAGGADSEKIVRGMQTHFGLGRLAASTRERFEAAVELHLDAE
jgi:hypothetical protein